MGNGVTRRAFLRTAGLLAALTGARGPGPAWARWPIAAAHSVSTFVYGQHLVAKEQRFFEDEGVALDRLFVPGSGAEVVRALAAGQTTFALGDSIHPLKLSEAGRDTVMLFATDTRCPYANLVVRKALHDQGVRTLERLADQALVGRRAVVAVTAIGAPTWVYGHYLLERVAGADGRPLNASVGWVAGGDATAMLEGLKAGRFDAIMAAPEGVWVAEGEGFGATIYDVLDGRAWARVFGGPIPVTVGYALRETVERSPEAVQGYVSACYRAQQWIRRASDEEILELLHRPYMDAFPRAAVLRAIRYYKAIFDWGLEIDEAAYWNGMRVWSPRAIKAPAPYAAAVEMVFVRRARQRHGAEG